MDIVVEEQGPVLLVCFEGSLDTSTSGQADTLLAEKIDEGAEKILIDFERLDYISSAGLRILLVAAKKLTAVGGELRVCCLNETVQEVFDISGFGMLLNVFEARAGALSDFG
jgi:stage II sporulation protein AA (anti-sigma F factor antagonist)